MPKTEREQEMIDLLDQSHNWPGDYTFKFVIKTELKSELDQYFEGSTIEEKYSSSGKYTSITVTKKMNSAEDVLDIYRKISQIPGVISL